MPGGGAATGGADALTDAVVISLIGACGSVGAVAVTGVVSVRLAALGQQQKEQEKKAQQDRTEVKETLAASTSATVVRLDGLAVVAASTHKLVNNAMSMALRSNAVLARKLAGVTGEESDLRAADLAESALSEHLAKQASVDAEPGTDAEKSGLLVQRLALSAQAEAIGEAGSSGRAGER